MVFFRRHPAFCSIAAGLVWTFLVGFLDVQTGIQLKLGPFYLLPVLLIAWHGGLWHGVFAALVAASTWRGIEVFWSSNPRPGSILFWDAFLHLVSFVAVSLFVSWANSLVKRERALVHDLSALLADVNELQGLLPMCAWCKKIRDDQGYWQQIETYISAHSKADWTHGICPECVKRMMKEEDDFLPNEPTQNEKQ
ncbi:MAG: hypothetical protein Q8O00_00360 [Holophaga sp.]|nr:hypothetical protein [Holophaga sp.]